MKIFCSYFERFFTFLGFSRLRRYW